MRKFLIISLAVFITFFAGFSLVSAAKHVEGTVPVLPPLQPPPADFKVDSTDFFNSPPAEQTTEPEQTEQNQQETPEASVSPEQARSQRVIWPYLAFVATVLAGYAAYKFSRRQKR